MTYKKLRRSGRLTKSLPILLIGSDTEGRVFSEQTHTVVLSLHGAGIVSAHKLLAEQELVLRSLVSNREAEIRVVGEIATQNDKHTYGVAFLDDSIDFWQEPFPPPPSLEERPLELVLECSTCGDSVTVLNGDFEFDVCAIHGGLVRYCAQCGFATVWRRPEPGAEPRRESKPAPKPVKTEVREPASAYAAESLELASDFAWQPLVEALAESLPPGAERNSPGPPGPAQNAWMSSPARSTAIAVEDRRNRVRAKVNYFACVRSEMFGDDIVNCIDMSRGGLGFRTRNAYMISAEVRIAVPFSPESPNAPAIFVPARVVNVMELPERKMFRCGVMFLPEPGAQAHT
jgi:PilZ domain